MPTLSDYAERMRRSLVISEPDLDTSVGTVARKIIDAVAELRAEAEVDKYLADYAYDIDSKSGKDLDDFVALFGFSRLPARRSTGTIAFERTTAPTQAIILAVGSQIATNDSPAIVVQTLVPALITTSDLTVSVPAQAVVGGAQGNVAAYTLRTAVTPIQGVLSFANPEAFSGGADAETDDQLRARWKRTAFRNLAGTESMFLGLALDDPAVTQANVIGASKRNREQVQVVGGAATAVQANAKYVYPDSAVFGSAIDEGDVLMEGLYYAFVPGPPAGITVLNSTAVPDGIYDLEFEYLPQSSRNDPAAGITNRVDVYVDGVRAVEATQTVLFRTATSLFAASGSAGPLAIDRFERRATGGPPVAGNHFTPLAFGPVMDPSLTNTIVSGGVTYAENVDYWLVNDITPNGGTSRSLSGIEWKSTINGQTKVMPADLTPIPLDYIFNAVPGDVETVIRAWRLVTTDVRVHQARTILLKVNLVVILQAGFTLETVTASVTAAVSRYLNSVSFDGVAQVSDVEAAVHAVPGIDAVRMATSGDHESNYAWQRLTQVTDGSTATVLQTYDAVHGTISRARDIVLADDQIIALDYVTIQQRAQNTWSRGTV